MHLFLAYTFETTEHANAHPDRFWSWMEARNTWFYVDLNMVQSTSWRIQHRPDGVLIHHEVAFADESGLTAYRAALADRGRDPAWEQRRREQDRWYRIVSRSVQTSPPMPMALPRRNPGAGATDRAESPAAQHQVAAGVPAMAEEEERSAVGVPASWFLRDPPSTTAEGGPVLWHSVDRPDSAFRASALADPVPPDRRVRWRPLVYAVLAALLLLCSLMTWAIGSSP
ncbi:hypothetical protein ABZX77_15020 [Streptomyces sp. NPDC004237]|uniref:hypothetical protein n=1 Tax=Streptomyces sp. NPDC004237 TaxID=3154455 RepID=UPI0033A3B3BA